ncbi:hypothetical protein D3C76_1624320 [compost metagenome]
MLNYFPAEQQLLKLFLCRLTIGNDLKIRLANRVHVAILYHHTTIDRSYHQLTAAVCTKFQSADFKQTNVFLLRQQL